MSTVAQRVQLGPFFSGGTLQGAAKLYHYAAGTSTLKNIWSDRTEITTLAQPFVADANGIFDFFADGLYKLIVVGPNSSGPAVDVLYTLDNWQFLDPQADILWDEGGAIASASSIALGSEVWNHISGSTDIDTITMTTPFAWLVFDGNLTLNYSANLLTPAAINLAVRANDVLFLLNEGSGIVRVAGHTQYDGLLIATQDSRTNTVDVALTVRSTTSGTPAAGIGTGILLQAESGDEAPSDAAQIEVVYSDVGAGTEDSYLQILLRVAGAALTACYRFVATGAFKAIFTHANSADRTYTLPNETTTLVGTDATQALTNKTITPGAAPATPTANVVYIESLVKGYVVFQVDGTIDTDLNVSSITDHGAGDWTVNWATAFSSANYGINLAVQAIATDACVLTVNHTANPTASALRINYATVAAATGTDPTGTRVRIYASAFGAQ